MLTRASVLLCASLAACSHPIDHAADLSPHASSVDGSVRAKLDSAPVAPSITLYSDETSVEPRPLRVTVKTAAMLASFPKGEVIAMIDRGTTVTELGERQGFYRVDLTNDMDHRTGWVARFAFEDDDDSAQVNKSLYCTGTAIAVRQDAPRCAWVCKSDRECRDGATCQAARVLGKPGEAVGTSYTTVCTPAAGTTAPAAKRPSLFGAPHDASGKCPRFFIAAPQMGGLCYRGCKIDRDCPQDATCKTSPDGKLCYAN